VRRGRTFLQNCCSRAQEIPLIGITFPPPVLEKIQTERTQSLTDSTERKQYEPGPESHLEHPKRQRRAPTRHGRTLLPFRGLSWKHNSTAQLQQHTLKHLHTLLDHQAFETARTKACPTTGSTYSWPGLTLTVSSQNFSQQLQSDDKVRAMTFARTLLLLM
jgi:hypothetical protein